MSEITLTRIGMMDRCVPVSSNLLLWVSSNLLLWVGCSRHGAGLSCPYDVAWVCQFQPGVDLVYGLDRGIRICMYTHIHTYTHTHIHTHIYIHIHARTDTQTRRYAHGLTPNHLQTLHASEQQRALIASKTKEHQRDVRARKRYIDKQANSSNQI